MASLEVLDTDHLAGGSGLDRIVFAVHGEWARAALASAVEGIS